MTLPTAHVSTNTITANTMVDEPQLMLCLDIEDLMNSWFHMNQQQPPCEHSTCATPSHHNEQVSHTASSLHLEPLPDDPHMKSPCASSSSTTTTVSVPNTPNEHHMKSNRKRRTPKSNTPSMESCQHRFTLWKWKPANPSKLKED